MNGMEDEKSKPPYWWAWFEIIPIIGAFVGLGIIIYGAIYYKSAKMIILGAAGILWTAILGIALWGTFMFYIFREARMQGERRSDVRERLERVAKEVEFYKFEKGVYPADLYELDDHDWRWRNFTYERVGEHYKLFSPGPDRVPNTSDDIYPDLPDSGRIQYGWVK
jgi:hypothetical protein